MGSAPSVQETPRNTVITETRLPPAGNTSSRMPVRANPAPVEEPTAVEEIVFETFHHKNGKSYCCIYTNGVRHYLDSFESGDWREFPFEWYDDGVLVTDDTANANAESIDQSPASDPSAIETALSRRTDDRSGSIKLPGRGTFETYVFEHRRNIHCFYDPDEGSWIKLPVKWELMTALAKELVPKVQTVVPQWHDESDIIAALRASNYNVDDCINTYHTTIGKGKAAGGLSREKSVIQESLSSDRMEKKLKDAEKKIKDLEMKLSEITDEKEFFTNKLLQNEELMATTKADCQNALSQMESMKQSRPKSAAASKAVKGKPAPIPEPVVQGPKPEDVKALNKALKEVRKVHIQVRAEMGDMRGLICDLLTKTLGITASLKQWSSGHSNEVEEVRALYRRECLQRKLLYNQLQELRGNIRVFCRIRADPKVEPCVRVTEDDQTIAVVADKAKKLFQFDAAFGTNSTQEQIFEEVRPIITSCADGYNVCILAYGQTGSGKTYTMQGPPNKKITENPGVNTRSIGELLKICSERDTVNYTLTVSMVEIYNETIQDLLSPKVDVVELRVQEQKVVIPGLTWLTVKTQKDIEKIITTGSDNRKVASTKMNSTSSRSHLLLTLSVVGVDKISKVTTRGQLVMVDLAGSERTSKTEATGQRLTEAAFINKSLTALGQVFSALRASQMHIPYRNSKLTHILQPCLGGDAKACLFINISPDSSNAQETVSTLNFGSNARQVTLGQAKQNITRAE